MVKIQLTNLRQATYVYHVSPSLSDLSKYRMSTRRLQLFEETQKCSNTSSWSDPAIEATPQTGSFASTQMPDERETKFELPSLSNLRVGIFTKTLQQLLEDQRPTKNTVEDCYASEENFSESLQPDVYTIFQSVLHDIFPWTEHFQLPIQPIRVSRLFLQGQI